MALGATIRSAIGTAWRGILSAVNIGKSATEVVTQAVEDIGQSLAPPGLLDTAVTDQLAGMAQSWVNARETFKAADDADPIVSGMVTLAPWSMDINSFNTSPAYHLVLGINVEGQEQPVYRTVTGITDLPATVGELRDSQLINAYAMSVGTTPGGGVGGTVTGLDSVTITVGPALG